MDHLPEQPTPAAVARAPLVLLLHGLTGGPGELAPLAAGLSAEGWSVERPWWPGHGTRVEQLSHVTPDELVAACRGLAARRPVAVVGLSMGALLALVVAAQCPSLSALVLLAPAVRMRGPARAFDWLGRLPLPMGRGFLAKETEPEAGPANLPPASGRAGRAAFDAPGGTAGVRYDRVPFVWARRLREVRRLANAAARQVRAPTLVLHGLEDRTADPRSALEVAGWLPDADVRLVFLPGAAHQLAGGVARAVVADEVARFLAACAGLPGGGAESA